MEDKMISEFSSRMSNIIDKIRPFLSQNLNLYFLVLFLDSLKYVLSVAGRTS